MNVIICSGIEAPCLVVLKAGDQPSKYSQGRSLASWDPHVPQSMSHGPSDTPQPLSDFDTDDLDLNSLR